MSLCPLFWFVISSSSPNVWLHSSVGRASHRYRGGHGFESRWSLDFFRLLLSNCLNWRIYCDDHSSLWCNVCESFQLQPYFGETKCKAEKVWKCQIHVATRQECKTFSGLALLHFNNTEEGVNLKSLVYPNYLTLSRTFCLAYCGTYTCSVMHQISCLLFYMCMS